MREPNCFHSRKRAIRFPTVMTIMMVIITTLVPLSFHVTFPYRVDNTVPAVVLVSNDAYAISADTANHINTETGESSSDSDEQSPYLNFDVSKIFSSDGTTSGSGLWDGIIKVIRAVTTDVLLPVGILFVTWRVLYLAMFPMMANIDPLHMLENRRYQRDSNPKSSGSGRLKSYQDFMRQSYSSDDAGRKQWGRQYHHDSSSTFQRSSSSSKNLQEDAKRCILKELRFMAAGLFIVFAVWGILQVIIQVASVIVGMMGGISLTN